jgi:exodeoxyribonuclease VII large subunit
MPQYDLFSDYVNTSGTDESSAVARESTAAGDSGYDRLSDTGAHENPVQPETSSMQPRVYTVPEINSQIASLFDEIPEVYVKGELSNCDNNRPDARFFYCVIKGSDSELSVAFPMGVIRGELNRIHNGVQVIIRGDVKFYRTKGRVTLWGSRISIIDRYGELYLQFLQTKDTL